MANGCPSKARTVGGCSPIEAKESRRTVAPACPLTSRRQTADPSPAPCPATDPLSRSKLLQQHAPVAVATPPSPYPSKAELLACLPADLLQHKPAKAWGSLALSLGLSLLAYGLGTRIPLTA